MALYERGIVHIYTGNGKGKTSAALGLVLRAAGHGARVGIIQFLKGWDFYGELKGLSFLPSVDLERTGRATFVDKKAPHAEDYAEATRGVALAEEWILSGKYDLIVLDEINVVIHYGLVSWETLRRLLEKRPSHVEVVLTGRYATEEACSFANLVTIMEDKKHPFSKGIKAARGREY